MRFETIYRVSLYLQLILASILLNMDADPDYARLFPLGLAIACGVALMTTDRDPRLALDPKTANFLGLASVGLVYVEYNADDTQLVLACGHWLAYLTLVKLFRPKTAADDWYLLVLGLMQVLVGCFLSQSDRVGMTLLAWAICGIWTLSLFYLTRESRASGPAAGRPDPYPGLMAPPFFLATLRAAATTLLCGVLIFLLMPRSAGRAARSNQGPPSPRAMTGFSDKIRLGQMGEILENEAVVMTVKLEDEQGRSPDDREWLWRGVVLTRYDGGSWERSNAGSQTVLLSQGTPTSGRLLVQKIHLEAAAGDTIFAIRPFVDVEPAAGLVFHADDGTISRESRDQGPLARGGFFERVNGGRGRGPVDYTVISRVDEIDGPHRQPNEEPPRFIGLRSTLTQVPPAIEPEIKAIAEEVVAPIDPKDRLARAAALTSFLRDSGRFHYSLSMTRSGPGLDPIVDFLRNTRSGHCEYFASSLAMLLRSVGIPARVVNGFKGGDWDLTRSSVVVRQKHAHSWVEASLWTEDDRTSEWITLDPTPGAERLDSVASVSQVPRDVRRFSDQVRFYWVFYVAGFNAQRQDDLLYGPVRRLFAEARQGFGIMGRAIRRAWGWATDFPSLGSFVSIKGFFVSTLTMLALAGAYRLGRVIWRRLARRFRARGPDEGESSATFAAYVRLTRLLAEFGLERLRAETPREFARRSSSFLAGRPDSGAAAPDVPGLVVDAYYDARYGGIEPSAESVRAIEARVDSLEAGLKAPA